MILWTDRSPRSASRAAVVVECEPVSIRPSVCARPVRSAAIAAGNESISAKDP